MEKICSGFHALPGKAAPRIWQNYARVRKTYPSQTETDRENTGLSVPDSGTQGEKWSFCVRENGFERTKILTV